MTKAEILKAEILKQYKSVRQFAIDMEIPYSTLVTALDRGIEGMAYGTVIRICDKLSLNPVDFWASVKMAFLIAVPFFIAFFFFGEGRGSWREAA